MKTKILRLGRIRYRQLKPVGEHRNNFYHICYVVKGMGYVILNGQLYDLWAGQVHVYHPAWTHDIWAQPHADFETLDLRFIVEDPKSFKLTENLPPFLKAGPRAQFIAESIYEIETLGTRRDTAFWNEAAHAHLTLILAELMQAHDSIQATDTKSSSPLPAHALRLMSESLPRGISIGRLAEHLFVSPTYLTTLMKTHFGKSAHELMIQLKIEHAKQKLATNPYIKIGSLAKEYGWKDVRHFRHHFKNETGMTPSAFVSQYRDRKASVGTDESWLVFDETVPMQWII